MRRALALCRFLGGAAVVGLVGCAAPTAAGAEDTGAAHVVVGTADELRAALASASGPVAGIIVGADIDADDGVAIGEGTQVTIDLAGHRLSIAATTDGSAGIAVPATSALTVTDGAATGFLETTGAPGGAGIGGGRGHAVGPISIHDAHVEATGGACGAGIGTGDGGAPNVIGIASGTVTAQAGDGAAALGGGCGSGGAHVSIGENAAVTASGTDVPVIGPGAADPERTDAVGSGSADGIAEGYLRNAGNLRIAAGRLHVPESSRPESPALVNTGRVTIDDGAHLDAAGVVVNSGVIAPSHRVSGAAHIRGNNVTVVFDAAGARATPPPALVLAPRWADIAEALPVAERDGARFAGWIGPDGQPLTTETALTVDGAPASTITVTADWRVTVTFEDADGTSVEIPAGSTVAEPAAPTREGYRFAGWATSSGEEWNFAEPVDAHLALVAVWEAAAEEAEPPVEAIGAAPESGMSGSIALSAPPVTAGTAEVTAPVADKADARISGAFDPAMLGLGVLVLVMLGTVVSGFRIGRSS